MISKINSVLKQNLELIDIDFVRWSTLADSKLAMTIVYKNLYVTKRNMCTFKHLKTEKKHGPNKYCIQYHFLTIRLNKKQVWIGFRSQKRKYRNQALKARVSSFSPKVTVNKLEFWCNKKIPSAARLLAQLRLLILSGSEVHD